MAFPKNPRVIKYPVAALSSIDISSPQNTNNNFLHCQLCDSTNRSAKVCRSQSRNHFPARANYAAQFPQQQDPWIVDSGAKHHIITDGRSLATSQDYHAPKEISMGNGNTIPISHTDLTTGAPLLCRQNKNGLYECPKETTRISQPQLNLGYFDCDWVGNSDDMKSTSGYCFNPGLGVFPWCSKRQENVAHSTAQVEFTAATTASNQALWL
ncbi:hypothetical protein KY290_008931 [Solanum tuberosum]|uniref:Uncharacterized protein n=1 Tax=Solanum tuberosum TaxID=4113 RepID=A0ABQ7W9X6_SOLTU|nr:hypothetical protein KY284_008869 [Solanum tuberosum]KAH0777520.1 hypothetical protein KY290_008931 [Solanum tuberosum]